MAEETKEDEQPKDNEGGTEENGGANESGTGAKDNEGGTENPPAGRTVNRNKHERDMAKMQEQLDAKDEELKGYKGLKEEFEQWKADQEAEKINSALKAAGCHNLKAAAACLDDFDGDIEKLKEEMPYLFTSTDKSKSTGGKQKGTPDPEDERTKRYRDIFGLSEKE